ncbi:MAG: iron ABC transporter permease [Youngiibacter sp.]|nr:iron ABC transporter permease [Youngiibacter sp.]
MAVIRRKITYAILFTSPFILIFLSLFIGRYPISFGRIVEILWRRMFGGTGIEKDVLTTIIWDIRLPRALLGALVGSSLAVSGAAFQGLFRNPLVSSGMLGVSSGAGFGAALAILIFSQSFYIYPFAFVFGLSAVILSYLIGTIYKTTPSIMLVLSGVIVSQIFSSLISLVKFAADPQDQLPTIVFWLMGSLASSRFKDVAFAVIPIGIGISGLFLLRWRINVLSMGDKEAKTLGINTRVTKSLIILFATLSTVGAVCVSGIVGWVGLVIPHIGRMIAGNDNRVLIPVSISLGASFMIIVDLLARNLTGSEIPLGILTSLIGAPFFVYLLKKTKGKGW